MKKLSELTRWEYEGISNLGLLYEFYPKATGHYYKDCKETLYSKLDFLLKAEKIKKGNSFSYNIHNENRKYPLVSLYIPYIEKDLLDDLLIISNEERVDFRITFYVSYNRDDEGYYKITFFSKKKE